MGKRTVLIASNHLIRIKRHLDIFIFLPGPHIWSNSRSYFRISTDANGINQKKWYHFDRTIATKKTSESIVASSGKDTMSTSSDDDSMELTTCPTVQAVISRWSFTIAIAATSSSSTDPNMNLHRKDWQRDVCCKGPVKFKNVYRLDIWSFNNLLKAIKQELEQ